MTMWNLPEAAIDELVEMPETGMGFQFVEAAVMGARKFLLVFNCEDAFDLSEVEFAAGSDPAVILRNGLAVLTQLDAGLRIISAPSPKVFKLLDTRIQLTTISNAPGITQASALTKTERLKADRMFYRFSAYSPDRRIHSVTGTLAPGTYTTTDHDESHVPSGFAAVGRYALPNRKAASYKYAINVSAGTTVEYGTVAPAFGQAGGGVEAFFRRGARSKNGAQPPTLIPDE